MVFCKNVILGELFGACCKNVISWGLGSHSTLDDSVRRLVSWSWGRENRAIFLRTRGAAAASLQRGFPRVGEETWIERALGDELAYGAGLVAEDGEEAGLQIVEGDAEGEGADA